MSSYRLHLNLTNTRYIWLNTCQQLAKLGIIATACSQFHILIFWHLSAILGIALHGLTFAPHINHLFHNCNYQLSQLHSKILPLTSRAFLAPHHLLSLSPATAATVIHYILSPRGLLVDPYPRVGFASEGRISRGGFMYYHHG